MTPLFIDTTVPLYAVGGPHRHKAACVAVLRAATSGQVHLHASAELVQEFLYHRLRRTSRSEAVAQARDVVTLLTLYPVDELVVDRMLAVVSADAVGGRDAVHAATALGAGFDRIVTTDSDFDAVTGLRVVAPGDALVG